MYAFWRRGVGKRLEGRRKGPERMAEQMACWKAVLWVDAKAGLSADAKAVMRVGTWVAVKDDCPAEKTAAMTDA